MSNTLHHAQEKLGRPPKPEFPSAWLFGTFDEAIATGDLDLAGACLRLIDAALILLGPEKPGLRSAQTELLRCHTRLWMLLHPEARAAA